MHDDSQVCFMSPPGRGVCLRASLGRCGFLLGPLPMYTIIRKGQQVLLPDNIKSCVWNAYKLGVPVSPTVCHKCTQHNTLQGWHAHAHNNTQTIPNNVNIYLGKEQQEICRSLEKNSHSLMELLCSHVACKELDCDHWVTTWVHWYCYSFNHPDYPPGQFLVS